jgi:hypothetical protein
MLTLLVIILGWPLAIWLIGGLFVTIMGAAQQLMPQGKRYSKVEYTRIAMGREDHGLDTTNKTKKVSWFECWLKRIVRE